MSSPAVADPLDGIEARGALDISASIFSRVQPPIRGKFPRWQRTVSCTARLGGALPIPGFASD